MNSIYDDTIHELISDAINGKRKRYSEDSEIYFPIICCEQEMSEIWQDGKRVMTVCQKCKKTWKPDQEDEKTTKWQIVKMGIKIDTIAFQKELDKYHEKGE